MSGTDEDEELTRQYRRLAAQDAREPSAAVRERIVGYARELAAQRTRGRIVPLPRPRAIPWRPAVFGTLAAAALTGLTLAPLLLHRLREPAKVQPRMVRNEPVVVELGAPSPPADELTVQSAPGAAPPAGRHPSAQDLPPPGAAPPPAAPGAIASITAVPAPSAAKAANLAAAPAAREASGARAMAADASATPVAGPDPLVILAAQGASARVAALLEEGRAVNTADAAGRTALLAAIQGRHADTARLLLEHGADPNLADHAGQTPLAAALRDGNAELAELLRRHGAR